MGSNLIVSAIVALVVLAAGAVILPDWAMFLFAMALAKGLVCLGIVGMMRGGVVSFGQGLYYCLGAYTATLVANTFGVSDRFLLTLLSAAVCLLVGLAASPAVELPGHFLCDAVPGPVDGALWVAVEDELYRWH